MLNKNRWWNFVLVMMMSLVLVALSSCTNSPSQVATSTTSQNLNQGTSIPVQNYSQAANLPVFQEYVASLIGFEEVPRITTQAQGQAILKLSPDGASLSYKLVVSNMQNIAQAHLHLGAMGLNGEVVVWIYPAIPPAVVIPGRFDGVLAEGTIQAINLVGPLAGMPLSTLVDRMNAGEVYVNIHTQQSPGGEIRGQINLWDATKAVTTLVSDIAGTVTAVTGNNISVQTDSKLITVMKNNATVIDTADVGPSAQLISGTPVQVFFDPATYLASKIEIEKPEDIILQVGTTFVEGTVTSASGMYVMIKTVSGDAALVETLAGTRIQFEDGTTASRTDIKPGVIIEATVRIGARWATRIEIKR